MSKPIFEVGQSASLTRTFTQADVEAFAALTGDVNPVHLDEAHAAESRFGRRICHGMLVGSLFTTLFGTQLPGPGALYLGQNLRFKAPVYPGDELTATVTLTQLREDKPIGTFETVCVNQDGAVVIVGDATLFLPSR
jgi:3-hydroxybutyryl-CoA dehydratase